MKVNKLFCWYEVAAFTDRDLVMPLEIKSDLVKFVQIDVEEDELFFSSMELDEWFDKGKLVTEPPVSMQNLIKDLFEMRSTFSSWWKHE